MASPKIIPNQYDLRGQAVRISYSTSSIAGPPQLSFTKGRQTLNFSGNDIVSIETNIGTLINVTIARVPDKDFTSFSFLLPSVELSGTSGKQAFQTIGVITIHKTFLAGPPKGVRQKYKVVALRGTAQRVSFIAKEGSRVKK